jgi:hypothetical protein
MSKYATHSFKFLFLAALLSFAYQVAYAQAYKCTNAGSTTYTQFPCIGGIKLAVAQPLDPFSLEARVLVAISNKRIIVGMSEKDVIKAWGKPDKMNVTASRLTKDEQWIFSSDRDIGHSEYVYFEDGIVTSWQSTNVVREQEQMG